MSTTTPTLDNTMDTALDNTMDTALDNTMDTALDNSTTGDGCADDGFIEASEFWAQLSGVGMITLGVLASVALVTNFFYLDFLRRAKHLVEHRGRRLSVYWLASLTSGLSWAAFVGLCVPRAGLLMELVISLHISICMYKLHSLLQSYFGDGRKADVVEVAEHFRLNLRSPPCCCCLCCLPSVPITKKTMEWVRRGTLQLVVIAPLTTFIACALLINGTYIDKLNQASSPQAYISVLQITSTLVAMYCLTLFHRLCTEFVDTSNLKGKLGAIQYCLLTANLQKFLVSLLATYNVLPCRPPISSQLRGQSLHFVLLIIEMLLLSVASRRLWLRHSAARPSHRPGGGDNLTVSSEFCGTPDGSLMPDCVRNRNNISIIETTNGIPNNGVSADGLEINGVLVESYQNNGVSADGLQNNGVSADGLQNNGLPADSLENNGILVEAYQNNRVSADGLQKNGVSAEGLQENGLLVEAYQNNGVSAEAYQNGVSAEALQNGVSADGTPVDGSTTNTSTGQRGNHSDTISLQDIGHMNGQITI